MTKKAKGKNPTEKKVEVKTTEPKGLELHKKFTSAVLEAIPGAKECVKQGFYTIEKDTSVLVFIRDKRACSVDSKLVNDSEITKILTEKGIAPYVSLLVKGLKAKESGQ